MTIKELFDKAKNGTLTLEQFEALAEEAKANFKDLGTGDYVSANKYTAELAEKDKQIETLNGTIKTRDNDLQELRTKLTDAGTDSEKLATLTQDFDSLKTKYDDEVKAYKAQLKKQSYEFAVREFANGKEFTSNAAKRDFIQSMINKELKMDGNTILGAEDFVKVYTSENSDAFRPEGTPEPEPQPEPVPKPMFVNPTPGEPTKEPTTGGFGFSFMPRATN